jgi:hypothetical protein
MFRRGIYVVLQRPKGVMIYKIGVYGRIQIMTTLAVNFTCRLLAVS